MIDVANLDDKEVVARTLWAEARSQGSQGMHAVANVILNRAQQPGWWGKSPRGVCLAKYQFSCWNPGDPQVRLIRADAIRDTAIEVARSLAQAALAGNLMDITGGADHYCTRAVAGSTKWAKGKTPSFVWKDHLFYRIGLSG